MDPISDHGAQPWLSLAMVPLGQRRTASNPVLLGADLGRLAKRSLKSNVVK